MGLPYDTSVVLSWTMIWANMNGPARDACEIVPGFTVSAKNEALTLGEPLCLHSGIVTQSHPEFPIPLLTEEASDTCR